MKTVSSLRFQPNTVRSGAELKDLTLAAPLVITTATGAATWTAIAAPALLNGCVNGALPTNRIGRKIRMKSLDIRWTAAMGAAAAQGGQIRVAVIYDKQSNAALPTIAQIFQQNDFHSPMLLSNADRFIVLAAWICDPIDLQGNFSVSGHKYVKLDLEVIFNDTNGGTIADIQTGSVTIMAANNGNFPTAGPTFTCVTRIRFSDE